MFNRDKLKRVCDESGLTKIEVAKLMGVSRPTLYDWLDEGEPQQQIMKNAVANICNALLVAVERKLLPLPRSLKKEDRAAKLAVMANRLHDAAPVAR